MIDAAASQGMLIQNISQFTSAFYDQKKYVDTRNEQKFGSAVDVFSGLPDKKPYISVKYIDKSSSNSYSISDIASSICNGKNLILTGSFGSGKSRCCKELFSLLSQQQSLFCIAIDLRDVGPLSTANQIIRAHFEDLGLDSLCEPAIQLLTKGKLIILLDGFDEMGGAQWSDDPQKLREIRRRTLKPIREIVEKSFSVFLSGREHYFNSDEELFDALGVNQQASLSLECKDEFTDEEIESFLADYSIKLKPPGWLPKRPLLYQILVELHSEGYPVTLDHSDSQASLWNHIISLIAKREARINKNFEEGVVLAIMKKIARASRHFGNDVEPVTLEDLKWAYKAVRGYEPADEDAVLLQKLPGLGRISYESKDRRFVDKYLIDGLRASELAELINSPDEEIWDDNWKNPLEPLGLVVLGNHISEHGLSNAAINMAKRASIRNNSVLSSDLICALAYSDEEKIDEREINIGGSIMYILDLSSVEYKNLGFIDCIFYNLHMPDYIPKNLKLQNSIIESVFGIPNQNGVPGWISNCEISNFEEIGNIASIKNYKLTVPQRILCVILHKTFFQPGRGRQEEALLRGLGQIDQDGVTKRILRILIREGFLEKKKGRHGALYLPIIAKKKYAARIIEMQTQADSKIWKEVSEL